MTLNAGGILNMNDATVGTLTITQSATTPPTALTLSSGTLNFDVAGLTNTADQINLAGNAAYRGVASENVTLNLVTTGTPTLNTVFTLITAGSGTSTLGGATYSLGVGTTSAAGQTYLLTRLEFHGDRHARGNERRDHRRDEHLDTAGCQQLYRLKRDFLRGWHRPGGSVGLRRPSHQRPGRAR